MMEKMLSYIGICFQAHPCTEDYHCLVWTIRATVKQKYKAGHLGSFNYSGNHANKLKKRNMEINFKYTLFEYNVSKNLIISVSNENRK